MADGPILDLVEYYPNTRGDDVKHKAKAEYLGVIERASDSYTMLSIRTADAKRAHNIEVGQVNAITVRGQRRVLQTPWGRWRIRAAEIRQVMEGELEDWAKPYFDATSPTYYRREPGYEDQRDNDAERKYRRLILSEAPPSRRAAAQAPEPQGCAVALMVGVVTVLALAGGVGLLLA